MKRQIKSIGRRLSRWPVVGHGVHILAAMYHLPRLRGQLESMQVRLPEFENTALAKLSVLNDATAKMLRRVQSVEQASIGLLTSITAQLGELKGEMVAMRDGATTAYERSRVVEATLATRMDSVVGELETQRLALARSTGETATRLDELGSALSQTNGRVEAQGAHDETLNARLAEMSEIVGNLTQSLPVVLREIRRDQFRIRAAMGSGENKMALDTETPALTTALDDLRVVADEQEGRTTERLRSTLGSLTTRLDEGEIVQQQTARQVQQFTDTLTFLVGRIEFVRRELMFEMRYGAKRDVSSTEGLDVEPRIIATDKVVQARTRGLRLNLGCGHVPLPDYVNVDRRELPGVDVVAEVGRLPFEPGEVECIMSSHVLEHFPQEQLTRELLPYWHGLLRTGGTFRAVVPDAKAMLAHYSNGEYAFQDMREVIYGAQDYDGDFHYNMFTPESLTTLLVATGFGNVRVEDSGRKNGQCYEFDVSATKL